MSACTTQDYQRTSSISVQVLRTRDEGRVESDDGVGLEVRWMGGGDGEAALEICEPLGLRKKRLHPKRSPSFPFMKPSMARHIYKLVACFFGDIAQPAWVWGQ